MFKNIEKWLILFIILFCILFNTSIYAIDSTDIANLSDGQVVERINYIQSALNNNQTGAAIWRYSWTGIYISSAGYCTYKAISGEKDERVYNIVGASRSGLSIINSYIIFHFYTQSAGDDLEAVSGTTPEERKKKLKEAENLLEKCYAREKKGRSAFSFIKKIAVIMIGSGIIYAKGEGLNLAAQSACIGFIGGGLSIWTQPTRSVDTYNSYKKKFKGLKTGNTDINNDFFFSIFPNGFVAGIRF